MPVWTMSLHVLQGAAIVSATCSAYLRIGIDADQDLPVLLQAKREYRLLKGV